MVARFTLCDRNKLEVALAGELPEAALGELSRHLQSCLHCRSELEVLAGGERWFGEARAYLSSSDELIAVQEITPPAGLGADLFPQGSRNGDDDHEEPGKIDLDFLAPSDDPTKLGRLGSYQIESVIGRGGFGIVLKAFDPALNRYVAIKALSGALVSSSAARKRFAREAVAAAAVVHDHVIPIHSVEPSGAVPFLVMPYITGHSLQERIDAQSPLETKEVLRIAMQTAQGLAAAHAQGLVHRDIKPANILLENGVERVRITDFGLARAVDDASQTQSGFIAGTPQYMAPEQARGESVDSRADLFSLGSVMYAMCTGRPPFRAETTLAVLRRICDDEPRGVREINSEVPTWLAAIIERLLAKSPAERFQTAAEVAEILGKWLAHVQQPTVIPPPAIVVEEKPRARSRKPVASARLVAGAGAIAAIVLAAAGLASWQGGFLGSGWTKSGDENAIAQDRVAAAATSATPNAVPAPTTAPGRTLPSVLVIQDDHAATEKVDLPAPNSARTVLDAVDAELHSAWQETRSLESALEQTGSSGLSIGQEIRDLTLRLDALEQELHVPPRYTPPAGETGPAIREFP